ncbi:MAG: hypothetical protein Q8P92_02325 [Candidatus Daviesbacteria bacterium]|nr:hypothetical protein [Candidatus Daviesbacteria bacterium]
MTIIRSFETEIEPKKFSKKYIILTLAAIFALVIVEIWVNNTLLIYGEKFDNLSNIEKNLKLENQILENQIARETSLEKLSSKSAELGFTQAQDVKYIP